MKRKITQKQIEKTFVVLEKMQLEIRRTNGKFAMSKFIHRCGTDANTPTACKNLGYINDTGDGKGHPKYVFNIEVIEPIHARRLIEERRRMASKYLTGKLVIKPKNEKEKITVIPSSGLIKCDKCKTPKPPNKFYVDDKKVNGRHAWCIECLKVAEIVNDPPLKPLIHCPLCEGDFDGDKFSRDRTRKSGKRVYCKSCESEKDKRNYQVKKEIQSMMKPTQPLPKVGIIRTFFRWLW